MKRLLPVLAALAFVASAAAWLALDPRVPHEAFQPGSVHNRSAKGASQAAAYLRSRGWAVGELAGELRPGQFPGDGTLFRLSPSAREGPLLAKQEEDWIRAGGRLVLLADRTIAGLKAVDRPAAAVEKTFPLWPGVRKLDPPEARVLEGAELDAAHALFASSSGPVLVRRRIGAGDLILGAVPEIFRNDGLARGDHLALLEAIAGPGRPVRFDEAAHGLGREPGLLDLLRLWGLGPLLVLGTLAALVAAWRARVRLGPPADEVRETRVEAVDFVDSLAILYDRVLRRRQAVAMYQKAYERALAVHTGLRGAALEARLKQELPGPGPTARGRDIPQEDFSRRLSELNVAFGRLNDAQRSRRHGPAGQGPRPA